MLYKVNIDVYVEAMDEEKAVARAHMLAFKATSNLRSASDWIPDTTTTFVGGYTVVPHYGATPSSYDKALLTRVFGEERAIRILNSY